MLAQLPPRRLLRFLRPLRRGLATWPLPLRHATMALLVGLLGALAVEEFRASLFWLEALLVGAHDGHLVAAAQQLAPELRLLAPALGGLAAGMLLWLYERNHTGPAMPHGGDHIEAVVIGNGRLDLAAGWRKVLASLLVVSTGAAVGREGAMVLLAAMLASVPGRWLGPVVDLRLVVSCGAAAGLSAAYHAPLAATVFVAEILLRSRAAARLLPVLLAALAAHALAWALGAREALFGLPTLAWPDAGQSALMLGLALPGGLLGAGLLLWLRGARGLFVRGGWPLPLALAAGGLVVGLLSLWRPEVWGNGYSGIRQLLLNPGPLPVLALVLLLKLLAVGASTGSGAPGGVFTPTLFVGASVGALAWALLQGGGLAPAGAPWLVALGMAVLLAGTTHAPVMAALMVAELCGHYPMLVLLLPASLLAAGVSRWLQPRSVYGL